MRFPCCVLLSVLAICSLLPAQTNPVPLVNHPLVPETAAPGAAGFQLTVNGAGFVSGAVVNWNGSPRSTSFISTSRVQASILASDLAAVGTANVTVSNPAPGGEVSNIAVFDITLPSPGVGFTTTTTNETSKCAKSVLFPQIVADFNGDGKQDIAGTVCAGGFVYVSLGNGDGTFQAPIYTAMVPNGDYSMTAADFNGDGKMDVAIVNDENNLAVMLGNGDGTFQPAKNYLTGIYPYSIAAADVNNDGKLDLILAANTDNAIDVFLGNGDGTFQNYIASPTGGVGPYGLAIADFNGDGKLDLATAETGTNEVTIMFGNGDGTFRYGADYFANFYTFVAADMNGDGVLDLVGLGTPLTGGYTGINIMFGNGDGTFQNVEVVSSPVPQQNYESFGVADLNGDGKPDIWTTDNGVAIYSILGNGNGTFQAPLSFGGVSASGPMVEGDFNNDGKPDFEFTGSCDGISCLTVALQSPVATAPTSLAFGTKPIGVRAHALPVTLANAGLTAVTITGFTFTGSNAGDFSQTNNCPSNLASTASCTIQVVFDPSIENELETASLSISDTAPGGGQQVALSGTGTYIRFSPATLNFGDVAVGQNSTLAVTVTNTKTSALTVRRIYIEPSPDGREFTETNNCGTSLAAGAACQVTVTFAPTSMGHQAAKVAVEFDGDNPPAIQLSGTGT